MTPILMSWSAGKDSALALDALRAGGEFQVDGLVTTVTPADEARSRPIGRRARRIGP